MRLSNLAIKEYKHNAIKQLKESKTIRLLNASRIEQAETFFGSTIGAEKEMIFIVAKTSQRNEITKAIKEKNYTRVLRALSDDKYRLFRIHPYGTIEWRGPRNFLDSNDFKIIKDFYKKFNTYIYAKWSF